MQWKSTSTDLVEAGRQAPWLAAFAAVAAVAASARQEQIAAAGQLRGLWRGREPCDSRLAAAICPLGVELPSSRRLQLWEPTALLAAEAGCQPCHRQVCGCSAPESERGSGGWSWAQSGPASASTVMAAAAADVVCRCALRQAAAGQQAVSGQGAGLQAACPELHQ